MSRVPLPAQHLSDEAIAAFADGALGSTATNRARRHVAECAECAHAVAEQRAAVWALRAAPSPSLPSGLLERLRAVPSTTPLPPPPSSLDGEGRPVFPAFGTQVAAPNPSGPDLPDPARPDLRRRAHLPAPSPRVGTVRRTSTFGLLTAAAAVVTLGTVSAGAASVDGREAPASPQPARFAPAGYSSSSSATTPVQTAFLVGSALLPPTPGR